MNSESNWQPIETAPKDEKSFLLIFRKSGRICIAHWDAQKYHHRPNPFWKDFGPWGVGDMRRDSPSHWMPLPKPPTTQPT